MRQLAIWFLAVAVLLPHSGQAEEPLYTECGAEESGVSIGPGLRLRNNWENPVFILQVGLDLNQLHEDVSTVQVSCDVRLENEEESWSVQGYGNSLVISVQDIAEISGQFEIPICHDKSWIKKTNGTRHWLCGMSFSTGAANMGNPSGTPKEGAAEEWLAAAPGAPLVTRVDGEVPMPPGVVPIIFAPPATTVDPDNN